MFRKRVFDKQITSTVKEGKTRSRLLRSKSSVKTYNKHTDTPVGGNEARSLLDVGSLDKHRNKSFEKEPTRSPDMKKHVLPSRLFSTPTHKDLESTKRRGICYTKYGKKLRLCSETVLMTREEISKMYHEKLSKSENQLFSISSTETNKHSEEGVHKQDLSNSNLYEDKTFAENFSDRSSSHLEPPFNFSSPPQSQIVTRSQIIANPPGAPNKQVNLSLAPRALFREESNFLVPFPLNQRRQEHLSSSELDDTSMASKEPSDNDERIVPASPRL